MKRNIGTGLALYPTPLVVIGVMANEKPNWVLVGHLGIMGHDRIMVSLAANHYTNRWIKENNILSVNIVSEDILKKADYVGSVSGKDTDKSQVFDYHTGDAGAPIINDSPVVIECTVDDIYKTPSFESFILKISNTYADEEVLNENGKIDYRKLKPVLFEFPTYEYLKTGDVIGKCLKLDETSAVR